MATNNSEFKPLLTVQEIEKIFKVSRRTIFSWMEKGILKTVKVGGTSRFRPEHIQAILEGNDHDSSKKKTQHTILAIDDDLLVRESLNKILEREGIRAVVVASGEEAVKQMGKEDFELILTDLRMPVMNGIETLQAIRDRRKALGLRPLPEIVLTGYDDKDMREEAEKMGVREFILKPFDLDHFLATLRKYLKKDVAKRK